MLIYDQTRIWNALAHAFKWLMREEPKGTFISSWMLFTEGAVRNQCLTHAGGARRHDPFFVTSVHRTCPSETIFGLKREEPRGMFLFHKFCSQKEASAIMFCLWRKKTGGTFFFHIMFTEGGFFKFCLQKNHSWSCLDATHLRQRKIRTIRKAKPHIQCNFNISWHYIWNIFGDIDSTGNWTQVDFDTSLQS